MSRSDPPRRDTPHRDVVELLPWYANGSLSREESRRVRRHLADCPACRGELAAEEELAAAVAAPTPLPAIDADAGLAALEERLGPRAPGRAPGTDHGVLAAWWRSLAAAPAAWRLAVAVPSVAAIALAALLVAAPWGPPPAADAPGATYTLLTDPAAQERVRLWVEVEPEATEGALRAVLRALEGQIVAGPTAQGVYTVAVPGTAEEAAERLRASGLVRSAAVAEG